MKQEFNIKFYNSVKKILDLPFKLIFNPKVIGLNNIPSKPYILAGNHKSLFDIPLIALNISDEVHFMAKKELFDNILLKFFLEKNGAFPVDRNSIDIYALKTTLKLLRSENVIGIFPEGTRNNTNEVILPFKGGVTNIALKTNSLIVPFGISGKYNFRSNICLNIGEPIDIRNIEKEQQTKYIEEKVKELILR